MIFVLSSILVLAGFSANEKAYAGFSTVDTPCSSTLDQSNEVPPSGSPGTGTMTGNYNSITNTLSWNISWSGLLGNPTLVAFHGPATVAQNAGVQVGAGAVSPSIGNAVITAPQESDLLAGLWYINIHTSVIGAGEIRGQVSCGLDVPIGGTYIPIDQSALLLAGVQSVSMWMIPVILAGAGIGIFVIKRRN